MPATYKGLTVPTSTDLADGPKAFRDYTDTLPASDALAALAGGVSFRVFTTKAELDAWAAPLGYTGVVVRKPNAFDPEIAIRYTRLPFGTPSTPIWYPTFTGVYVPSSPGTASSGTINFPEALPFDPSTGGYEPWIQMWARNGVPVRVRTGTLESTGFMWEIVTYPSGAQASVVSWALGPYQSYD